MAVSGLEINLRLRCSGCIRTYQGFASAAVVDGNLQIKEVPSGWYKVKHPDSEDPEYLCHHCSAQQYFASLEE